MRPICTVAVAGVTVMELNVAAGTVKVAEPDLVPDVAVIVAVPADTPVATPVVDRTVAIRGLPEVQATVLLMLTGFDPSGFITQMSSFMKTGSCL